MGFVNWIKRYFMLSDEIAITESKVVEKKLTIVCPFCLVENSFIGEQLLENCNECNRELPPLYRQSHEGIPVIASQILGWPSHGKTTYISGLTLVLERMRCLWPKYNMLPATEPTVEKIREIRHHNHTGSMPAPTPLKADQCYNLILRNLGKWDHRTLVLRDCAGETSENFDIPLDQAKFLLRAPTTLMFFSPGDLEATENQLNRSIDELMSSYLNTMSRAGVLNKKSNHKIVVVITKGDKIRHLPQILREYLMEDPIWKVVGRAVINGANNYTFDNGATRAYLIGMTKVDQLIRTWLLESPSGGNFINLAEEYHIPLRFCIISSTGGEITPDQAIAWSPRRVLDPFFWTLEFDWSK